MACLPRRLSSRIALGMMNVEFQISTQLDTAHHYLMRARQAPQALMVTISSLHMGSVESERGYIWRRWLRRTGER